MPLIRSLFRHCRQPNIKHTIHKEIKWRQTIDSTKVKQYTNRMLARWPALSAADTQLWRWKSAGVTVPRVHLFTRVGVCHGQIALMLIQFTYRTSTYGDARRRTVCEWAFTVHSRFRRDLWIFFSKNNIAVSYLIITNWVEVWGWFRKTPIRNRAGYFFFLFSYPNLRINFAIYFPYASGVTSPPDNVNHNPT